MKSILTLTILSILALDPSLATAAAPASAAVAPASAADIAKWQAAVTAREQRVALLKDEIKAADARFESRIDSIVDALRQIGDSKDSRTKVARMKEKTIDGLSKTLAEYRSKRASLQEELRRPTWNLTAEQKQKGIAVFDARMEKRVAQILALQKSLPTNKDYDRYETTGYGWWGSEKVMSEDYKQNLRVSSVTNTQRREIEAGLRKSIERLEQQNRTLRANGGSTEEIAKNDTLIAERRSQLKTAMAPVETPTRQIGGKEAADLDKSLNTSITDLRRDFNTIFARYFSLIQATSDLNNTRAGLARAKGSA